MKLVLSTLTLITCLYGNCQKADTTCETDCFTIKEALNNRKCAVAVFLSDEREGSKDSILEIPKALTKCSHLEVLGLYSKKGIRIKANLGKLKQLQHLDLVGDLKDRSIAHSKGVYDSLIFCHIQFLNNAGYIPKFVYWFPPATRLLLEFKVDSVDFSLLSQSLEKYLSKTSTKAVSFYNGKTSLDKVNLTEDQLKCLKTVKEYAVKSKAFVDFFGIRIGGKNAAN